MSDIINTWHINTWHFLNIVYFRWNILGLNDPVGVIREGEKEGGIPGIFFFFFFTIYSLGLFLWNIIDLFDDTSSISSTLGEIFQGIADEVETQERKMRETTVDVSKEKKNQNEKRSMM